ncbi:hypothetical protein ACFC7A_15670 [Streptomyces niveus]|uniref:hypothetical protein n=1 Tax=Streptomyces niveus TaxID=193462 RepID=UPI0035DF98F7
MRAAATASAAQGGNWPRLLADRLGDIAATWQESAEVCADATWQARATGTSALRLLDTGHLPHADAPVVTRALRHIQLTALRYDFRCRRIEALLDTLPARTKDELDCYTRALWAFALLGQSRTSGYPLMEQVLDESGLHAKTVHVLLHGLWLGHGLPGREEAMLRLASMPVLAGDPIARFRAAAAHRGLGNYRPALKAIDDALDLLSPEQSDVRADFVRERCLITAADDIGRLCGTPGEQGEGSLR